MRIQSNLAPDWKPSPSLPSFITIQPQIFSPSSCQILHTEMRTLTVTKTVLGARECFQFLLHPAHRKFTWPVHSLFDPYTSKPAWPQKSVKQSDWIAGEQKLCTWKSYEKPNKSKTECEAGIKKVRVVVWRSLQLWVAWHLGRGHKPIIDFFSALITTFHLFMELIMLPSRVVGVFPKVNKQFNNWKA